AIVTFVAVGVAWGPRVGIGSGGPPGKGGDHGRANAQAAAGRKTRVRAHWGPRARTPPAPPAGAARGQAAPAPRARRGLIAATTGTAPSAGPNAPGAPACCRRRRPTARASKDCR